MPYFLAKTDPDTYSIDDFEKEGTTIWDSVHNNAAILFIQQMRPGDLVYIYESMTTKAIVGLAKVTTEPKLNTNDPRRSWIVDMQFIKRFKTPATLAAIKSNTSLMNFKLVRESRLSVMPVTADEAKKLQVILGE